ncbi:AzlD domain-containing protein [Vibrio hyugaensis]|uniref:AzlD domain-containing protein n=1 Tax=Vibrio hyugaensis TaxID=1534743 RepID=UPI001FD49BB5|nr:AzlD domain-containing protein [Vibrio hyugaensis]
MNLKLGVRTQKVLSYASPAVLTAIWTPIVFIPEGELSVSWQNPFLLAALLAAAIAYLTKNVLLTTIVSMVAFLLLRIWL